MTAAWYRTFFGPDFWRLADEEYTGERTATEAAYLVEVLSREAPGRRVVDLGSGLGRHAAQLTAAGFEVVGVDQSAWAVERARGAEPRARWLVHDLLTAAELPFGPVDAAICVQSFGWSTDAAQRRLLRRLRRHLAPGGLLVLDVSSASAILRAFVGEHAESLPGARVTLRRSFDVETGCNLGSMEVAADGEQPRAHEHRIRLYGVHEARALLREAGWSVLRCDADFTAGRRPDLDSRYVQLLARPVEVPPRGLAIGFHARTAGEPLDLRGAPDEGEFLDPDPATLWTSWLREEAGLRHGEAAGYRFDDPYGGGDLAPVLGRRHGCELDPACVTAGAGITGLLQALAGLAGGGTVLCDHHGHPDLPVWARAAGAEVVRADLARDGATGALEAVADARPDLVLLDRPAVRGVPPSVDEVRRLARAAADAGSLVVVDEAYWNYLDPRSSAVRATLDVPNLVVLGGISKAYRMGGLRVGWAVASGAVAAGVRELVPPLACASLSLAFARHLLGRPGVLAPLRDRVPACRAVLADRLEDSGLPVLAGSPALPWVAVEAGGGAAEHLRAAGIAAKLLRPAHAAVPALLRLAVPLSGERLASLERRLPLAAGAAGEP